MAPDIPTPSTPDWYDDAAAFFDDPQGKVIGWVAGWLVGLWFAGVAAGVELVLVVQNALLDAGRRVVVAIASAGGAVLEALRGLVWALEAAAAPAIAAAGPFAFVFVALFAAAFLWAVGLVLAAATRIFRRVVV